MTTIDGPGWYLSRSKHRVLLISRRVVRGRVVLCGWVYLHPRALSLRDRRDYCEWREDGSYLEVGSHAMDIAEQLPGKKRGVRSPYTALGWADVGQGSPAEDKGW